MKWLIPALFLIFAVIAVVRVVGTQHPAADRPGSTPPATAGSASESSFESWWQDGRAELDGYRLTVTRYGEARKGQAVLIYVTEPFSRTKSVKVDDPAENPADTFEALKLNLVRDFRTGIYDYNTMVSLFVRSADFEPVKLAFTSAEWCGQVYHQMIFGEDAIQSSWFSYFEDESGTGTIERKPDGIAEDNLFIILRGLRGAFLPPGGRTTRQLLPGPFVSRLTHRPAAWTSVEIERAVATERVEVPGGAFDAMVYVVRTGDGRVGRFHIESAYPHRVVRWSWSRSRTEAGNSRGAEALDTGELAGSLRTAYWKLNAEGAESYLEELGLGQVRP